MITEVVLNESYSSIISSEEKENYKNPKERNRTRIIRTEELFKKLNNITCVSENNLLLPANCRFVNNFGDHSLLVVEEEPSIRTIFLGVDMSYDVEALKQQGLLKKYGYTDTILREKKKNGRWYFTLSFPYIVSVTLTFQGYWKSSHIFFRQSPLRGLADLLFLAPLYNIDNEQQICLGNIKMEDTYNPSIIVKKAMEAFWNAEFNTDYISNVKKYIGVPYFNSFFAWEHQTNINPMFVFRADMLQYDYNLGQLIENIKSNNCLRTKSEVSYYDLYNAFTSPQDIKTKDKDQMSLFSDIVSGIRLYEHIFEVGDEFPLSNGTIAYVDSFIGYSQLNKPSYIRMRQKEKTFLIKLTPQAEKYISKTLENFRYLKSVELSNKFILKPGMFVKYTLGTRKLIQQVEYIRHAPDDQIELRLGNSFFNITNLPDDLDYFDIDNLKFYKIKMEKGKTYMVCTAVNDMISRYEELKLDHFDVSEAGQIKLSFYNNAGNRRSIISMSDPEYKIFEKETTPKVGAVVAIGRQLLYISDGYGGTSQDGYINGSRINIPRNFGLYKYSTISTAKRLSEIYTEGKLEFKSTTMDYKFEVGDKVVSSNWKDPLDMLKIKTITEIKLPDRGNINVILTDKNNNQTQHYYVERYDNIKIGTLRKVTNDYDGLRSGMKIVAKETGIPGFMKKDVNIIVAFVIDTGVKEPFVLCSNGMTLWYSDVIEKFDIIERTNPSWQKLSHSPIDISKIKVQSGDIVKYGTQSHIIGKYPSLRAVDLHSLPPLATTLTQSFRKNMIIDSILSPRVYRKDNTLIETILVPTYHGTYKHIISPGSGMPMFEVSKKGIIE